MSWLTETRTPNLGDPVRMRGTVTVGLVIRTRTVPCEHGPFTSEELYGVQLPGDEAIRWMHRDQLRHLGDGAWVET